MHIFNRLERCKIFQTGLFFFPPKLASLAYWGSHRHWICGFVCFCRYKGKSYRASVRIVCLAEQVADFCRRVCVKLQCCPNLFGPTLVSEKCPENCSIHTKTKYSKCLSVDWKRQEGKKGINLLSSVKERRRCILRLRKERQVIS